MNIALLALGCFGLGVIVCAIRIGLVARDDRLAAEVAYRRAWNVLLQSEEMIRHHRNELAMVAGREATKRLEPRLKRIETQLAHLPMWGPGTLILDDPCLRPLREDFDHGN